MSTLLKSTTNIDDIITSYITTGQGGILLNVNRLTIRRWVKSGRLTGHIIANFTLISRLEIDKLDRKTINTRGT
jgi:hypothetical protein